MVSHRFVWRGDTQPMRGFREVFHGRFAVKISKRDFEEAASKGTCFVCGRVFDRISDTKIHIVKIHVLDENGNYYTLKENGVHIKIGL
jgi:hypothetical protein